MKNTLVKFRAGISNVSVWKKNLKHIKGFVYKMSFKDGLFDVAEVYKESKNMLTARVCSNVSGKIQVTTYEF